MKKGINHFSRTLEILQLTKINMEKPEAWYKIIDQSDADSLSEKLEEIIRNSKNLYADRLKEIYAIEQEKFNLRDTKDNIRAIFKKEESYNLGREKLLGLSFSELQKIELVTSPLVRIYEADWKWFLRYPFQNGFDLKKVLATKKEDHYFLLEKTGTFDDLLDSNISDFPLIEYQYFLLQLFEKSKKVEEALEDFYKIFEIADEKAMKNLIMLTEKIMKELIFRRFIVQSD